MNEMMMLLHVGKEHFSDYWRPNLLVLLLTVLVLCMLFSGVASAGDASYKPLTSIAQIVIDEEGQHLDYPVAVTYDPVMEEIYVVNGGQGRIVVYGPDYFPRIAIGEGRGVIAPQGLRVMSNGDVYICQAHSFRSAKNRISILNGAFFLDREIFLDQIPEAANFIPKQLAVNSEGLIYLVGANYRGVLVLDNEGTFLRRVQPEFELPSYAVETLQQQAENEAKMKLAEEGKLPVGEAAGEESAYEDIPEEFRPRQERIGISDKLRKGIGPVKINYVTIDSVGKLYLVSAEIGKIFVYGSDESFLFSFGQKGGSPRQMSQPRALVIDEARGLIFVSDYMRHTILVYDMSGKYVHEFGGRGDGDGWFNFPSGMAIDKHGYLIVADQFNKRIQILDARYKEFTPEFQASLRPEESVETSDGLEAAEQENAPEAIWESSDGVGDQGGVPESTQEQPDLQYEQEDASGAILDSPENASDQKGRPESSLKQPGSMYGQDDVLEVILETPAKTTGDQEAPESQTKQPEPVFNQGKAPEPSLEQSDGVIEEDIIE